MKKLTVMVLAVLMVISLSVVSFAQGGLGAEIREQRQADRQAAFAARMEEIAAMRTEIAARKQALSTKREEFEAFRTELNELRAQAIEAMKANNAVRAENARLGSELKQSLESLKNEGTELSQEVIDGLNGYKENLAVLREELKTSKDQILDIRRRNGEFRSSKDYAALIVSFTQIVTIQGQRNECLTDINADLQAMLALLVSEG
ncbi:MAG: hypothetical protein ACYC5K_00255 [Saccharofermentanales bacterium]